MTARAARTTPTRREAEYPVGTVSRRNNQDKTMRARTASNANAIKPARKAAML
jgi:hypothetical protein